MHVEVIDHANRILQHVPTRCMRADALHERAVRETAQPMPYPRFLEALRARSDRFVLLDQPADLGPDESWSREERDAYAAALAAAGCTDAPVVALAAPSRPAAESDEARAELLSTVHEALAELVHAADEGLHDALAAAAAELESLSRALDRTGHVRPAS